MSVKGSCVSSLVRASYTLLVLMLMAFAPLLAAQASDNADQPATTDTSATSDSAANDALQAHEALQREVDGISQLHSRINDLITRLIAKFKSAREERTRLLAGGSDGQSVDASIEFDRASDQIIDALQSRADNLSSDNERIALIADVTSVSRRFASYKTQLVSIYNMIAKRPGAAEGDESQPSLFSLMHELGMAYDRLRVLHADYLTAHASLALPAPLAAALDNARRDEQSLRDRFTRDEPYFLPVSDTKDSKQPARRAAYLEILLTNRGLLFHVPKPGLEVRAIEEGGETRQEQFAVVHRVVFPFNSKAIGPASDDGAEVVETYDVLEFNFRMLMRLQAEIDPAEIQAQRLATLEEELLTRGSSGNAAGSSEETTSSDTSSLSAPRRLALNIERNKRLRASYVTALEENYKRYLRSAYTLGEEGSLDALVGDAAISPALPPETRNELVKALILVGTDVAALDPQRSLTAQLTRQESSLASLQSELTALADSITQQRSLEATSGQRVSLADILLRATMRPRLEAQHLRIATLRDSTMGSMRARRDLARSLLVSGMGSLAAIDSRIVSLEQQWQDAAIEFYGFRLVEVAAILLAAFILIAFMRLVARRILARYNAEKDNVSKDQEARAKTLTAVFMAAVRIVVWVTALLMILARFEINYQPLLLATGGITLALGFGAQSLVKDFFYGFFIILENQFTIGDVITIGARTGSVEAINLRTTRLRSVDGTLHVIPNGEITGVSNMTHKWSRMIADIGVGYNEDPDEVREILNRIGQNLYAESEWAGKFLEAPTVLGINTFGASSVDFRVMARTIAGEQWSTAREFRRRVKLAFDALDIEIPFTYVNHVEVPAGTPKSLSRNEEVRRLRQDFKSNSQQLAASNAASSGSSALAEEQKQKDSVKSQDENAGVDPEKRPDRMPGN